MVRVERRPHFLRIFRSQRASHNLPVVQVDHFDDLVTTLIPANSSHRSFLVFINSRSSQSGTGMEIVIGGTACPNLRIMVQVSNGFFVEVGDKP